MTKFELLVLENQAIIMKSLAVIHSRRKDEKALARHLDKLSENMNEIIALERKDFSWEPAIQDLLQ